MLWDKLFLMKNSSSGCQDVLLQKDMKNLSFAFTQAVNLFVYH